MRATPCSACPAPWLWLLMSAAPRTGDGQTSPEDGWASETMGEVAFLSVNAATGSGYGARLRVTVRLARTIAGG